MPEVGGEAAADGVRGGSCGSFDVPVDGIRVDVPVEASWEEVAVWHGGEDLLQALG